MYATYKICHVNTPSEWLAENAVASFQSKGLWFVRMYQIALAAEGVDF